MSRLSHARVSCRLTIGSSGCGGTHPLSPILISCRPLCFTSTFTAPRSVLPSLHIRECQILTSQAADYDQIYIHRPLIGLAQGGAAALAVSVAAANASVSIIEHFGSRFGYAQSFFVPYAFNSAVLILLDVWYGNGDLSAAMAQVGKCITALDGAQKQCVASLSDLVLFDNAG